MWAIIIPVTLVALFELFLLWDSARYYDTIKKDHAKRFPTAFKTPKEVDDKLRMDDKVIYLDEWERHIS